MFISFVIKIVATNQNYIKDLKQTKRTSQVEDQLRAEIPVKRRPNGGRRLQQGQVSIVDEPERFAGETGKVKKRGHQ